MKKRAVSLRHYFLLDMSSVVRFLTLSDLIWMSGAGLLGPIFAIFIVDYIQGGDAVVAGIAASIYLFTKSILQIPAASIVDKIRGEKDDFWVMFVGSILGALLPLMYLIIQTPMQLYFVQFVFGAVIAFTFPSFMAVFTRHIDKHKEGREWGIYFTLTDFGAAFTASIGGVLAQNYGFSALILISVAVSLLGVSFIWWIRPYMRVT